MRSLDDPVSRCNTLAMPDQQTLKPSDYAIDSNGDAVRIIKSRQPSTDGLWVVRYLDGRTPTVGARYADQGLHAVADLCPTPLCGHGLPIYGTDCDGCDTGNAESDAMR